MFCREGDCAGLEIVVEHDNLPEVPVSPDHYAEMMRELGHDVVKSRLADIPPELGGEVVAFIIDGDLSPIFVREEICRMAEQGTLDPD